MAETQSKERRTGPQIAREAADQLRELTSRRTEAVVGLERTDDGWHVTVETVELERVPRTTDVLATYELDVDKGGELVGYRRLRRYVRGTPDEE